MKHWNTELDNNIWRVYHFVGLTPNTFALTLLKHCMADKVPESISFTSFCMHTASILLLKCIYRIKKRKILSIWQFWVPKMKRPGQFPKLTKSLLWLCIKQGTTSIDTFNLQSSTCKIFQKTDWTHTWGAQQAKITIFYPDQKEYSNFIYPEHHQLSSLKTHNPSPYALVTLFFFGPNASSNGSVSSRWTLACFIGKKGIQISKWPHTHTKSCSIKGLWPFGIINKYIHIISSRFNYMHTLIENNYHIKYS